MTIGLAGLWPGLRAKSSKGFAVEVRGNMTHSRCLTRIAAYAQCIVPPFIYTTGAPLKNASVPIAL